MAPAIAPYEPRDPSRPVLYKVIADHLAPRRARDPLGADAPMGRVGARTLAVLDGLFTGPHRAGPYDHPYHDRAVLCEPGGHTRCPTRPGPTGVGDVYPTFWQCRHF